jgi:hypothetical protein
LIEATCGQSEDALRDPIDADPLPLCFNFADADNSLRPECLSVDVAIRYAFIRFGGGKNCFPAAK